MIPEGHSEYYEVTDRWLYPDGRIVDCDPVRCESLEPIGIEEGRTSPKDARVVVMARKVTIDATGWSELKPNSGPDVKWGQEIPINEKPDGGEAGFVAGEDIPTGSYAGTFGNEVVLREKPGAESVGFRGFVPSPIGKGQPLKLQAQPSGALRHWVTREPTARGIVVESMVCQGDRVGRVANGSLLRTDNSSEPFTHVGVVAGNYAHGIALELIEGTWRAAL